MKRKIGELFNKPLVQGNENVLSSNEILVEQKGDTINLKERVNGGVKVISGGSSGGNTGGDVGFLYFDVGGVTSSHKLEMLSISLQINNGTIASSSLHAFESNGVENNISFRKICVPYGYPYNEEQITTKEMVRELVIGVGGTEITEQEFFDTAE